MPKARPEHVRNHEEQVDAVVDGKRDARAAEPVAQMNDHPVLDLRRKQKHNERNIEVG
jgi:hypothetical protein